MKSLAVVILNWNGRKHLETYLPSVSEHSQAFDVIVVDNASTDDSVSFIKEKYPEIQIISNNTNEGFAKGYNDGLLQIKGQYKYYVLLNSDVAVTANWIEPLLEKLEADATIAAMQPKILSDRDRSSFEHAGAAGGFMDTDGYPFCRGRIFFELELDKGQYDTDMDIFWATGACMFVRAKVFHELGGFDADFFAHMEEIDLCWRMQLCGHKIQYAHASKVYHLGGGTLDYSSPRKIYLNFRNSLFTIYKNYQGFLFGKILKRFVLDYVAMGSFLLKREFRTILEVFKAQKDFLGQLSNLKRKRKSLKEKIVARPILRGTYSKSIVWSFFFQGKKKFQDLDKSAF